MKEIKRWFTIAELIVLVTIIAILSTIWYLYVSWNLSKSRDSKRLTDLDSIEKSINLFRVSRDSLPIPDQPIDITYSWSTLWKQGILWSGVMQKLASFWKDYPKDPFYNVNYTYSIAPNIWSFEIAWILENPDGSTDTNVFWTILWNTNSVSYLIWNYNWFFVSTIKNGLYYLIASPSLTTIDPFTTQDILLLLSNQKLSATGFKNYTNTYSLRLPSPVWWFPFVVSTPVAYSWTIDNLYKSSSLIDLDSHLRMAYSWSLLKNTDKYASYIKTSGITKIKYMLWRYLKMEWKDPVSCTDIKDSGNSTWTGYYTIDSDWPPWPLLPTRTLCNMTPY